MRGALFVGESFAGVVGEDDDLVLVGVLAFVALGVGGLTAHEGEGGGGGEEEEEREGCAGSEFHGDGFLVLEKVGWGIVTSQIMLLSTGDSV